MYYAESIKFEMNVKGNLLETLEFQHHEFRYNDMDIMSESSFDNKLINSYNRVSEHLDNLSNSNLPPTLEITSIVGNFKYTKKISYKKGMTLGVFHRFIVDAIVNVFSSAKGDREKDKSYVVQYLHEENGTFVAEMMTYEQLDKLGAEIINIFPNLIPLDIKDHYNIFESVIKGKECTVTAIPENDDKIKNVMYFNDTDIKSVELFNIISDTIKTALHEDVYNYNIKVNVGGSLVTFFLDREIFKGLSDIHGIDGMTETLRVIRAELVYRMTGYYYKH